MSAKQSDVQLQGITDLSLIATIKPGFVETDMTKGMGKLLWMISADEAARLILEAVKSRANERFVPRQWWLVALIIRSIPRFVFKKLNV